MKPRPCGHGSAWPAHAYWVMPADLLLRLVGVPGELRDADVAADRDRARGRAGVLVGLQRDVDAGVGVAAVLRQDARVDRAVGAAVVERDGDRAARAGGDRGLELIGRRRVGRVVDGLLRPPREPAVGGLPELDVELARGDVPVLIGQVDVPGYVGLAVKFSMMPSRKFVLGRNPNGFSARRRRLDERARR